MTRYIVNDTSKQTNKQTHRLVCERNKTVTSFAIFGNGNYLLQKFTTTLILLNRRNPPSPPHRMNVIYTHRTNTKPNSV